jgi:hypothetical protein
MFREPLPSRGYKSNSILPPMTRISWQLVRAGGSYFTIVNNNSKLLLDTSGGEVIQNSKSSGQSQQWKLVPVS